MDDKPRLRRIEAFPVEQDGKTLIYLKDPLNLARPLGISPVGYFILSHFDGRHSLIDIQEACCKQFGTLLLSEELKELVNAFDQHYYLDSDRFRNYRDAMILEFRRLPTRAAAHVGGVYSADAIQLKNQLDGYFSEPAGPGMPVPQKSSSAPRAIVAPHIDFRRGGAAYAWAYKALAESDGADLYILLGTSHCGGQTPYILTLKDFATPLGVVETDREFVNRLQTQSGDDYFADEYLHRGEHSLEFQVVFLKYIAQRRAAMTGQPERPFKIVPILVSSFHAMMMNGTPPEKTSAVGMFLRACAGLRKKNRGRFVSSPASILLMSDGNSATASRLPTSFLSGSNQKITTSSIGWLRWMRPDSSSRLSRIRTAEESAAFRRFTL